LPKQAIIEGKQDYEETMKTLGCQKAKSNKLFANNFFNEILPLLAEIALINQILNSHHLKTLTAYL
jgi:hypothetical protein